MKIIQVGLGEFGFNWLKEVLLPHKGIEIKGLVDGSSKALDKARNLEGFESIGLFTSLEEALSYCKPDLVLNFTPPAVHKNIDFISLKNGIPVLSEKPIAETYDDALEILALSGKTGIPVMISENYRFFSISRKVRELISSGAVGPLTSISVDFRRRHRTGNYHMDMKHPLLLDVTIHHLDLVRYFTGAEANSVHARSWNPSWSWYDGYTNLYLLINMDSDIMVSYRGSLTSFRNETDWLGEWRIEGKDGIIRVSGGEIHLVNTDTDMKMKVNETEDSRKLLLDNFICSLKEGKPGETDIHDNIKTFEIVWDAVECIEKISD